MATGTANLITETPRKSHSDINGNRSYTYRYAVAMDTAFAEEADVLASTGLPAFGTYKDGTYAHGYDIEIDPNNPLLWFVDVTYQSQSTDGFNSLTFDGSNNRLLSLGYGTRTYSKTIDAAYEVVLIDKKSSVDKPDWSQYKKDDNYTPLLNSAEDHVVGMTDTIFSKIIRFSQIEDRFFDPNNIYKLLGTINAEKLRIAGCDIPASEGTIINFVPELKNITASGIGYPDGKYWVSAYEVEIMEGGWYQKVINEGYRQIVDGKKVDIFNKDINANAENPDDKVQEPEKLALSGALELNPDNITYIIAWSKWGTSWKAADFVKELDD